uniref:EamA domain-containing protein n=1 Tax=Spongospora subterranea TaxID=70186 RepID=A0A0H5RP29_9EUKA|eukprot:CRZ10469.1 hypothetical protein [Spongospora subterranea]
MAGGDLMAMIMTGILWGCTNPFLNQKGTSPAKTQTGVNNRLWDLFGIFLNWKFILPYGINQLGSVLYVYTLKNSDISMALPVCNALALSFTALTGRIIGERPLSPEGILGVITTMIGVSICFYSKL